MSIRARVAAALGSLAVIGLVFLISQSGRAGDDSDTASAINKIADLIAKGDKAGAETEAKALAKKAEVEEVMHLFKPRKKKGLGVGKAGAPVNPDGIEQQFLALGRDPLSPAALKKAAKALERMGYQTAAVSDFAIARPPEKSEGKKTPQQWITYSKQMRDAATEFVAAVKSGSSDTVHKAAEKVNTACSSCHSDFRD